MLKQISIGLLLAASSAGYALAEQPIASGEGSSAVPHTARVSSSVPNTEDTRTLPNVDTMPTQAIPNGPARSASAAQRIQAILQGEGEPGEVVVSSSNPDVVYTLLPNGWIEKKNTRYGTAEYSRPRRANLRR